MKMTKVMLRVNGKVEEHEEYVAIAWWNIMRKWDKEYSGDGEVFREWFELKYPEIEAVGNIDGGYVMMVDGSYYSDLRKIAEDLL